MAKIPRDRVIKLRSIGLSDSDYAKLQELMDENGVSSRSEMIRRLLFTYWIEKHREIDYAKKENP